MDKDGIFGGSWIFAIIVIILLFGGGNGFGWGGNGVSVETAVNSAIANQSTATGLRDVLLSSANNNYETLQAINGQTMALMNQGYTNQINAVQGFNQLSTAITAQGNQIQDAISRLGYQLDSCCCSIKTQMLQDRYEETLRELTKAQTDASNAAQSAYLLSVMGKWIANAPAAAV